MVRDKNIIVGVLAVPADRRPGGGERARRLRRQDHLQLLRGAARRPARRAGAHVQSGRRAAARALLPSDLGRRAPEVRPESSCGTASDPLRRLADDRCEPAGRATEGVRVAARCRRRLEGRRAVLRGLDRPVDRRDSLSDPLRVSPTRPAFEHLLPARVASAAREDPHLARLPARRHGFERLHPRARARVGGAGHDVTVVCQERAAGALRPRRRARRAPGAAGRTAPGLRARPLRGSAPEGDPGLHARRACTLRRGERRRPRRAAPGRSRVRQPHRPGRAGRRGCRLALRGEGARLRARVLDARQRRADGVGERGARARRGRLRRLRAHPARGRGRRRPGRSRPRGAPGRRRRRVPAAPARRRRSPRCSRRRAATRRTRATARSVSRTRATPNGSRRSSPATSRPSSTSASSSTTRASTSSSRRCARVERARSSSGSATIAASSRRSPRRGRSSRARSSTGTSSTCSRSRTRASCPRSSRRRSAWSPPRPRPPAPRRSSRATPASPRSRRASRRSTRPSTAHWRASRPAAWRSWPRSWARCSHSATRRSRAAAARLRRRGRRRGAGRRAARTRRGQHASAADRRCLASSGRVQSASVPFPRDGRRAASQCRRADSSAREAFDAGTDFTVAVEEEFALLDPDTLGARQPLRGAPGRGAAAPSSSRTSSAS